MVDPTIPDWFRRALRPYQHQPQRGNVKEAPSPPHPQTTRKGLCANVVACLEDAPASARKELRVATWETVCDLLGALPGTEQGLLHDNPALRVRGKLVAYLPNNSRSRPAHAADHEEFVVVRTDFAERAALLEEDPETFFVTPHYENYPGVIVRLATVRPDQLRELLIEAWRPVAPKRLVRDLGQASLGSLSGTFGG